jgi:small conductance mechanosensitive channel
MMTTVANNKIFADNIQNYSANPYSRVNWLAQLAHEVDHNQAITLFKAKVSQIPNVLDSPAPDVEIITFNLAGPVLAVHPYCNNDYYWQVYFDTNKAILETFGEAGYAVPNSVIQSIIDLSMTVIVSSCHHLKEVDTETKSQACISKN